jgi:hypothetical protein
MSCYAVPMRVRCAHCYASCVTRSSTTQTWCRENHLRPLQGGPSCLRSSAHGLLMPLSGAAPTCWRGPWGHAQQGRPEPRCTKWGGGCPPPFALRLAVQRSRPEGPAHLGSPLASRHHPGSPLACRCRCRLWLTCVPPWPRPWPCCPVPSPLTSQLRACTARAALLLGCAACRGKRLVVLVDEGGQGRSDTGGLQVVAGKAGRARRGERGDPCNLGRCSIPPSYLFHLSSVTREICVQTPVSGSARSGSARKRIRSGSIKISSYSTSRVDAARMGAAW